MKTDRKGILRESSKEGGRKGVKKVTNTKPGKRETGKEKKKKHPDFSFIPPQQYQSQRQALLLQTNGLTVAYFGGLGGLPDGLL